MHNAIISRSSIKVDNRTLILGEDGLSLKNVAALGHTLPNRGYPKIRYVLKNDTLTGITTDGDCSLALDNEYVYFSTTGSCIRMTHTSSSSIASEFYESTLFNPPIDLANTHVIIPVYIHDGQDAQDPSFIAGITLYFYDGTTWGYFSGGIYDYSQCDSTAIPGLRIITGPLVSSNPSLDFSYIQRIKRQLTVKSPAGGKYPTITWGNILFVEKPTVGQVYITVDDYPSPATDYDDRLFHYMASKGLVGTAFCIKNYFADNAARQRRMFNLAAEGHLLANHCNGEPWASWDLERKIQEINDCARALIDIGLGRGARIVATPGGVWHPSEDWLLLGNYVDVLRSTQNAGATRRTQAAFPRQVWCTIGADTIPLSQQAVEDAFAHCSIAVLLWHPPFIQSNWNDVKAIIDTIANYHDAGQLEVLTCDHLINPFRG